MKASEMLQAEESFLTPIPLLNELVGGIPVGVIVEVAGPYSVGKSTLVMQIVAQAQRLGKKCYWADSERSLRGEYAAHLGVDLNELEYDRQQTAEQLLDNMMEWANKNKNGVIVLDAIGSLAPREEIEKGAEGRSIGLQARMIGAFCRRIVPVLDERKHTLIAVNHTFVDPTSTRLMSSGGKKWEYARSLALWLKEAYGKPAKRSADGSKIVKFIECEIKKSKTESAEGKKSILELVVKEGFVGEFVKAPEKKKPGRPAKVQV